MSRPRSIVPWRAELDVLQECVDALGKLDAVAGERALWWLSAAMRERWTKAAPAAGVAAFVAWASR